MTIQYAKYEMKTAYLSSDFGLEIATKWFGEENVNELPKYVKGKNKGKPKGHVSWIKCHSGGWIPSERFVENRKGKVLAKALVLTEWGGASEIQEIGPDYGCEEKDKDDRNHFWVYTLQQCLGGDTVTFKNKTS
tara:strand:- start:33 stop:434 length:402 start_codon:yes stop_codon:yes gene_type:complete